MAGEEKGGKVVKTSFQKFYAANRDPFLAKRRDRYASDPEYAKKQREQAKDYRDRKKAEKGEKTEKVEETTET